MKLPACSPWIAVGVAVMLLAGCAAAQKMSPAQLAALGIREGVPHWQATAALSRQGYACFVSGARREDFDCTRTVGFFPTCVLRVRFTVGDDNRILTPSVAEPACMGTP